MATLTEIARRCRMSPGAVSEILTFRQAPTVSRATVERVFKTAMRLGYDFAQLSFVDRRQYPRRKVNIPVQVSLLSAGGRMFDRGTAVIRDLSLGGAKLTRLRLGRRSLPLTPFTVVLQPKGKRNNGTRFTGELVRFHTHGERGYGVRFTSFSSGS